jgi:flagellar motor switch protein FliG
MPEASNESVAAALNGSQRSAILLMYLARETAKKVLQHLTVREVEDIGRAMVELPSVEPQVVELVVRDFVRALARSKVVPSSGRDFALGVFPDLVGGDRGRRVGGALRREYSTDFQELCSKHSPRTIAALLQDEHPQTRAVALLMMGTDTAARVIGEMDEDDRLDLSIRMARIDGVPASVADDIERSVRDALDESNTDRWKVTGIDRAAQVLGRLPATSNEPLLTRIGEADPDLSSILRRRMVTFKDLGNLDDRSIQTVLKSVERQTLIIALRGADATMREIFLRNMSSRAASDLAEEIELLAPQPKAEVVRAQEELVQIVQKLAAEGVVRLYTGGEELV